MSDSEYKPVTVGNWIITLVLVAIPLVNVIMLIIWAVAASTHPSKRTFATAYLVLIAILFVIGLFAAIILPNFVHHPAGTGV